MSLDIRSPVLHQHRTWVTDYLITAHSSNTSSPKLSVFTGSNEYVLSYWIVERRVYFPLIRGDIALLSNMNTSVPDAPWCLHKLWTHGHVGVVRTLVWDEKVNAFFFTCHRRVLTALFVESNIGNWRRRWKNQCLAHPAS